jgi:hypothetical protein
MPLKACCGVGIDNHTYGWLVGVMRYLSNEASGWVRITSDFNWKEMDENTLLFDREKMLTR